jgi:monoamine oxidase
MIIVISISISISIIISHNNEEGHHQRGSGSGSSIIVAVNGFSSSFSKDNYYYRTITATSLRRSQRRHRRHDLSSTLSLSSSLSSAFLRLENKKNTATSSSGIIAAAATTAAASSYYVLSGKVDDNDENDDDDDDTSKEEEVTTKSKVLIIGAGFSGISVAYHIMKMMEEEEEKEKSSITKNNNNNNNNNSRIIDIEIIEARDRIGGRVHSYNFDEEEEEVEEVTNCWIDLGGQWLHGASDENPIRRLMEDELNLSFVGDNDDDNDNDDDDDRSDQKKKKKKKKKKSNTNTNTNTNTNNRFHKRRNTNVLFDKYGNRMNKGIVQRAKNIFYKSIDDLEIENEQNGNNDNFDDNSYDTKTSYQDLINNRLKPLYNEGRQRQSNRQSSTQDDNDNDHDEVTNFNSAINYFIHRSEENEGGQLDQVSANLANNLYYGFDGPDLVPKGSYKSVLDGIITKLNILQLQQHHDDNDNSRRLGRRKKSNKSSSNCQIRLRMNTKVKRIEYDNDDSEVSITVQKNTNNINANTIDQVVEEEEEEEEEEETLKADYCVCTVPLGVLKSGDIEFIPPLSKEKQKAINGIGFGILNKIVYKFPYKFWGNDIEQFAYCHDDISLIKTYYDCTDDYIINTTPNKESEAILIQFLAGKAADRVDHLPGSGGSGSIGGITDKEIIKESLNTLRLIFGINKVPEPIGKPIITRWNNDPNSYGSYSYTKINSSAKMYNDIASPATLTTSSSSTSSLFFAGEHTSKHYHSTVHGAWLTGKREAERIMERISNQSERMN